MCPFSSLSSRGEDYRVRIPRKICFGLMGPFRRVNALVRLENACPYWRAGRKRGEESVPFRGREEEKKGRKEGRNELGRRGLLEVRGYKVAREGGGGFMDTGETVSRNRQIKQKSIVSGWRRNWSYWAECEVSEI